MRKKYLYPGLAEAEAQKNMIYREKCIEKEPDLISCAGGISPNYEKFNRYINGWNTEKTLVWCNMD